MVGIGNVANQRYFWHGMKVLVHYLEMIQSLFYIVTIPFKLCMISILTFREKWRIIRWPTRILIPGFPREKELSWQFEKLQEFVPETLRNGLYDDGNPDHQMIRHGSLTYAVPHLLDPSIPSKLLITDRLNFKRGVGSVNSSPPAVPISMAFALINHDSSPISLPKYRNAVRKIEDLKFKMFNSSSELNMKSTGFDGLFATAMQLSASFPPSVIKTHWPLMLAPIAPWKNRNYHIDHFTMLCCFIILKRTSNSKIKWVAEKAMTHVWSLSRDSANPYFASLMADCGLLSAMDRDYVLQAHKEANLFSASKVYECRYDKKRPCSWLTSDTQEFLFDDLPGQRIPVRETGDMNYLNGLVLGKSLLTLLRFTPRLR